MNKQPRRDQQDEEINCPSEEETAITTTVIKKGKKHMMAGKQNKDLGKLRQGKGEYWHR